jgi:hypothetical protein
MSRARFPGRNLTYFTSRRSASTDETSRPKSTPAPNLAERKTTTTEHHSVRHPPRRHPGDAIGSRVPKLTSQVGTHAYKGNHSNSDVRQAVVSRLLNYLHEQCVEDSVAAGGDGGRDDPEAQRLQCEANLAHGVPAPAAPEAHHRHPLPCLRDLNLLRPNLNHHLLIGLSNNSIA